MRKNALAVLYFI